MKTTPPPAAMPLALRRSIGHANDIGLEALNVYSVCGQQALVPNVDALSAKALVFTGAHFVIVAYRQ